MTRRSAICVLTSALMLAGCGNQDATPPPPGSRATLDGTYAIDVAEEDLTKSAGAEPGRWTIAIASRQATLNGPGGQRIPLMPITLTDTKMVVPADPQCPNNRPSPGKGTYEVHLRGESLRFKKLRDPCGDRAFTLTVHTWRRAAGS